MIEPLRSPLPPALRNEGLAGEFLGVSRDIVHVRDRTNSGSWFQGQLSIGQAWRALVASLGRRLTEGGRR